MTAADLHLPAGGAAPRAAAVVLHPHPGMGGDRRHPLVVAVAEGLAGQGIAALRPDLSHPDPARAGEALDELVAQLLADTDAEDLVLVGYSWGSVVVSRTRSPQLRGRVLVAPPVGMLDLAAPDDGVPVLALVPAHDQFGGPEAVEATVATWPASTVEVVPGADHFLAGAIGRIAERAVAWCADRLGSPP